MLQVGAPRRGEVRIKLYLRPINPADVSLHKACCPASALIGHIPYGANVHQNNVQMQLLLWCRLAPYLHLFADFWSHHNEQTPLSGPKLRNTGCSEARPATHRS